MTDLIRRFKGLGVALVVLAMSAGAVFAAAPQFVLTSDQGSPTANTQGDQGDQGDQATETPEPTETPDATDALVPGALTAPDGTTTNNHGALVSAAAQMTPPPDANFVGNHGAWVSCVAHIKDATIDVATFDWTTVTNDYCLTLKTHGNDQAGTTTGQAKSQAGKANGKAKTHGNGHSSGVSGS